MDNIKMGVNHSHEPEQAERCRWPKIMTPVSGHRSQALILVRDEHGA
jgi:hypothetical protein